MDRTEFENQLGGVAETVKESFKATYEKRFKGTELASNYDFLAVVLKSLRLVGKEETEKIIEGIFKDNVPVKIAATWFKTKVELDEANRGVKKTLFVLGTSTPRKYKRDGKDHFVATFNFVMDGKVYLNAMFDEDTEVTKRVQPFRFYDIDVLLKDGKFDGLPEHFSVIPVDREFEPDEMRQMIVTQFTNFQPPITAEMSEGGSFYFLGKVLAKADRIGKTSFTIGLQDGNSSDTDHKINASVDSSIGRNIENFDMVIGTLSVGIDGRTSQPRAYTDFVFPLKKFSPAAPVQEPPFGATDNNGTPGGAFADTGNDGVDDIFGSS